MREIVGARLREALGENRRERAGKIQRVYGSDEGSFGVIETHVVAHRRFQCPRPPAGVDVVAIVETGAGDAIL